MNEKALTILEYHKIIDRLESLAGSAPGKSRCRSLRPSDDINEIRQLQTETTDALSRIYEKGSVSFAGVSDIRSSLARLSVGASLNIQELLGVCRLLDAAKRVKAFARAEHADEARIDSLTNMFSSLEPLTGLSQEIHRCILSDDEIADDASPKLKSIRRNMGAAHEKIRSVLNGMVNGSARNYLQDAVITQRNGRFCLPVKAEHRGSVPGMIHDQSSTGSTIFVEPMAVVKLNNDIRELELSEEKEIEVILATLSGLVADQSELIIANISILTSLDFIFARAMLSKSYNGFEPDFNADGIINIKKGRHPLLDPGV